MIYSKTTGGFYSTEIHGQNIPGDGVLVEDATYVALLEGQAAGLVISGDSDGNPVLTPAPPPAPPTAAEQIRTLEARYADAQAKITRQSLLTLALDRAMTYPEADGMTREQVHAVLMGQDNSYAALYGLEQQVESLRNQT